jgi:hypothetical protein
MDVQGEGWKQVARAVAKAVEESPADAFAAFVLNDCDGYLGKRRALAVTP